MEESGRGGKEYVGQGESETRGCEEQDEKLSLGDFLRVV